MAVLAALEQRRFLVGSLLRSRLSVILIFGSVLLALDVGRSFWARVALEIPTTEYRPDPAHYADLTWPPGADLRQDAPLGAKGLLPPMCCTPAQPRRQALADFLGVGRIRLFDGV